MKKPIISLLIMILCLPLQAHEKSYVFGHIAPSDGLSSGTVTALMEDHDGFLWIGTVSGLHRFDGFELQNILFDESTPQGQYQILDIEEDAEHHIWIKTYNNCYVVSPEYTMLEASDELMKLGLYHDNRYQLHVDKQGNLWNYSTDSIYCLDYASHQIKAYAAPHLEDVNGHLLSIAEADNRLYVINRARFLCFDKQTGEWQELELPEEIEQYTNIQAFSLLKCYADKQGGLWVFSLFSENVVYRESETSAWKNIELHQPNAGSPVQNSIRSIEEDSAGNIWIATDHQGIFLYRRDEGIVHNITNKRHSTSSLRENNVTCLMLDSHQNMWAGHFKSGISFHHPKYNLFERHATDIGEITSLLENEDGSRWIGTDGHGLLLEQQDGSIRKADLEGCTVTSLAKDHEGVLWIGTYDRGLFSLENRKLTHFTSAKGDLPHDNVTRLVVDSNGLLWICSSFGSFYRFDPKTKTYDIIKEKDEKGEHDLQALSLCVNPSGRIHVGTVWGLWTNDAVTMEGKRRFGLSDAQPFVEEQFLDLYFDAPRQLLWMSHRQGISIYDQPNDTLYEIPAQQAYALLPDTEGNVWFNSNDRLTVVTPTQENDGKYSFKTSNYSTYDMQQPQLSFNSMAATVTQRGTLLFGCLEGYCEIDPKQVIAQSDNRIKPTFASVKYNNRIIDKEELQNWRHHDFPLHITLFSGNPLDASVSWYSYRIVGISDTWQVVSGNQIDISNLPWGERFELQVCACGTSEEWSEPVSLFIETDIPLSRTPLMIVIYIILTAGVVGTIWRIIWVYQRKKTLRIHRHKLHDQHVEMTRIKLQQMNELVQNLQQQQLKAQEFIEELKSKKSTYVSSPDDNEEAYQDDEPAVVIPRQNYPNSDEDFIQRCISICETNMSESSFGVEELRQAVGMSRSQLYKRFMAITGRSPLDVIRSVRMKRAKKLLDNSELPFGEIAQMVGYNTLKTFTENFKQEYGMTPSEYQRKRISIDY